MIIEILKPFGMKMSVVEVDDNIPSFKVDLAIKIERFSDVLTYADESIWFDCEDWDLFVKDVSKLSIETDGSAVLKDMSEKLELKVLSSEGDLTLCLRILKNSKMEGCFSCNYEVQIDLDVLAKYKDIFGEFPTWW